MNEHSIDDRITALAPLAEQLDQEWAESTLARIVADESPRRAPRRTRRRVAAIAVTGALTLTTGAAVAAAAGEGPFDTVKDVLLDFADQPNTSGNDVGTIHDPLLVAQVEQSNGVVFAVWIATTSSGDICSASTTSDATWDGGGSPAPGDLEYGCGEYVVDLYDPDPNTIIRLERPDQLGNFFEEGGGPVLYGISPYPDAVAVHVHGAGVDRTLPVREDSLGYGAALPGATDAASMELTFSDAAGRTLGSRTLFAPVD